MEGQPRVVLTEFIVGAPSIPANAVGKNDRLRASPIVLGARVKMTLLGATRNPHFARKEGTVVGRSRLNGSFRILFDGRKTSISLHRDYIEPSAPE
jgi:hypothetical protein